ncbi:MAG: DUF6089 family protein [Fermentimonas sp.]|nr:DUF6089 family protein [Fermentimonas sp.]HBT84954.1 hypothetical protein [Porphyromonadaceae bacterium]
MMYNSNSDLDMSNCEKTIYFFILLFNGLILPSKAVAQEFKYEIGGTMGTSFYMGDVNKTRLYLHPGISGGALFRYNINFNWAIKANLFAGQVSGDSEDTDNILPFDQNMVFSKSFTELGAQVEFNFLPYSDKYSYIGTKSYSPYVFLGTGITYSSGEGNLLNINMPLGIGFKYKVRNRINVGVEFSMRKLFSDSFDSLDNPYNIKSSMLKNKDWYSLTMIFLTWEFGSRTDPCHGM